MPEKFGEKPEETEKIPGQEKTSDYIKRMNNAKDKTEESFKIHEEQRRAKMTPEQIAEEDSLYEAWLQFLKSEPSNRFDAVMMGHIADAIKSEWPESLKRNFVIKTMRSYQNHKLKFNPQETKRKLEELHEEIAQLMERRGQAAEKLDRVRTEAKNPAETMREKFSGIISEMGGGIESAADWTREKFEGAMSQMEAAFPPEKRAAYADGAKKCLETGGKIAAGTFLTICYLLVGAFWKGTWKILDGVIGKILGEGKGPDWGKELVSLLDELLPPQKK